MKNIILSAILLVPLSAAAQTCQTGNVYTDLACHERQIPAIRRKLDAAYAELRKINLYDAHKRYAQSQKIWQQWVKTDCEFESTPAAMAQGAGYGLVRAACTHQRYAERLKQVEAIVKELREEKASGSAE